MTKQQPFILFVEDDAQLRSIVTLNLRAAGYMVFEAGSFREAMDRMAIKPNLIVLDITLPDATGWDVANWLEQMTSPVPVIVTSGLPPDAKNMEHFRPKAYLAKPFAIDELLDLVQQYAPVA
ncbi:MAG: response regulator [Chloroflexota bacterium]